jgi:vancomycin resistance protein VanJ
MTLPSRLKRPAWLPGLIVAYGLFLLLLTVLNESGADRWWPGAFNLYLPQAVWLAPVGLLLLLSLRFARRWLWVLGFYLLWVGGPIMGFRWAFGTHQEPVPAGTSLRVMTCNIKDGQRDAAALFEDIVRYQPDVIFFQDVSKLMRGPRKDFFREWNVNAFDQYVIASRLPLAKASRRVLSLPDEPDCCMRTELLVGQTPVTLYNVHLLTPREGLNAFRAVRRRPGRFLAAVQELQENVERRLLQAQTLAEYIRKEPGLVIVAGDLNSPDGSLACRTLRDVNLHDAFAEGGRGYGYTYGHLLLHGRLPWLPGISWMRIDHIMLGPGIRSRRCWTGNGEASEHRPVFADLLIPAP